MNTICVLTVVVDFVNWNEDSINRCCLPHRRSQGNTKGACAPYSPRNATICAVKLTFSGLFHHQKHVGGRGSASAHSGGSLQHSPDSLASG